jgi:hypothetical protein
MVDVLFFPRLEVNIPIIKESIVMVSNEGVDEFPDNE